MKNNKNGISFIVPAFNCADMLPASIDSILKGNMSDEDEIIVINDCSTDDTGVVAETIAAENPNIYVIHHKINKGSAAAGRNTGIENARNDILFCLDADNILVPGSVDQLKRHMIQENADAAAFQEIHYFSHGTTPDTVTHKWIYKSGEITLADALSGYIWPGPSGNYLFTKKSWLKAGRYNESVGGAIDSWAFGIMQLISGSRLVTLPDTYYFHRWDYDSTYRRNEHKQNLYLSYISLLLPHIHLFYKQDIIRLLKKPYTRDYEFYRLPLRVRNSKRGINGIKLDINKVAIQPKKNSSNIHRFLTKINSLIR